MAERKQDVLVVGVGNVLLRDEGLGVHIARALEAMHNSLPDSLHVFEAGTALLDFLPDMARYECVILVDAIRAGREPGTLYRADGLAEIAGQIEPQAPVSLHGLDLGDTLRMAELLGFLPAQLSLMGAEPANTALGPELSPPLKKAAEKIVSLLLHECRSERLLEEHPAQVQSCRVRSPFVPGT
jgi:hydrogenase maturation protease